MYKSILFLYFLFVLHQETLFLDHSSLGCLKKCCFRLFRSRNYTSFDHPFRLSGFVRRLLECILFRYIFLLIDFNWISFADYLIVELDADVAVFFPSSLRKPVSIELLQARKPVFNRLSYLVGRHGPQVSYGQISNEKNMISYARHEFYSTVRKHIYLFNLVGPEVRFRIDLCHRCDIESCEP